MYCSSRGGGVMLPVDMSISSRLLISPKVVIVKMLTSKPCKICHCSYIKYYTPVLII